eukprot:GHRQ01025772.1.p2 GENE.GHRQ01025772.1~~GHRQ01025772.1.p2  ORF type:complete len:122 (+),score=21.96 GHRQ01025772.1:135-500(+)
MSPVQLLGGDPLSVGDPAVFGVITVSDRASSGVYEDLSGPAILQFFSEAVQSPWTAKYAVIPDEQPIIEQTIKDMVGGNGSHSSSTRAAAMRGAIAAAVPEVKASPIVAVPPTPLTCHLHS